MLIDTKRYQAEPKEGVPDQPLDTTCHQSVLMRTKMVIRLWI